MTRLVVLVVLVVLLLSESGIDTDTDADAEAAIEEPPITAWLVIITGAFAPNNPGVT